MAITDVPDSPLSTVEVLVAKGAAQFPLTLLLLQHLQGDGGEFRSAGEDAVGIEFGLFHIRKIDRIGGEVNRLGTVPRPSHIMLGDGDQLRVFNATGQGLALPTVEGLSFGPFVHDILNQVA